MDNKNITNCCPDPVWKPAGGSADTANSYNNNGKIIMTTTIIMIIIRRRRRITSISIVLKIE